MILILILLVPVLFLALLFLTSVVIPFTKLRLFHKKGMTFFFYPLKGYLQTGKIGFEEKGDFFARFKGASKLNPNDTALLSNIGGNPLLLLRDPTLIKEYYRNANCYNKVGSIGFYKPLFGTGLLYAEGDVWKNHRKIISTSFHYEALKSQVGLIQNTTKEFLDKVGTEGCEDYSIINKIQEITGEIVGRIFFGEKLNDYTFDNKPLTIYLADLLAAVGTSALTPLGILLGPKLIKYLPRHKKILKKVSNFRELCHKIIDDRKAQQDKGDDLLATLLATQNAPNPSLLEAWIQLVI